jgi:hypothetical protein
MESMDAFGVIHRGRIGPAAVGCPNAIGARNPAPHTRFPTIPGMRLMFLTINSAQADAPTLKGPSATEI